MKHICIAVTLLAAGCVTDTEPTYSEHQLQIEDGTNASQFAVARAAYLLRPDDTPPTLDAICTATMIADDVALTALHCAPVVGDVIAFWDTATSFSASSRIASVTSPAGAEPDDPYDSHGNLADIAVVRLASPAPAAKSNAILAWHHPGDHQSVIQVGGGEHDGTEDAATSLRQRGDYTLDGQDDGAFLTRDGAVDFGDSGGPTYYGSKLLGVLRGISWDGHGKHTSVPFHLPFILDAMGWEWPHNPIGNIRRTGPVISTLNGRSLDTCAYACDKTSTCRAFNFDTDVPIVLTQCQLLSSVDNATIVAGFKSASK